MPCARYLPLQKPTPGREGLADQAATLRDSFSEFASGIWKHFIRAKREYRRMGPPPELQNGKVVQSLNETLDPSVREFAAADPTYAPPNLWRYRSDHEPGFSAPPPAHHYVEPGGIWWLCLALWLALIALAGWQLGGWLESRLVWVAGIGAWRWLAIVAPLFALLADWRESSLNHKTTLEPEGMEAEKRLAWMDVYLTVRLGAIAAATAGLGILAFKLGWTWLRRDLSLPGPLWGSLVWLLVSVFLWVWFQTTLAWSEGPMTDAGLGSIVQLQRERTPSGVQRRLTRWAGSSGNGERRQVLMPVVRALWRDMLAFIPVYTVFLFLGSWVALSLAKLYFWGGSPLKSFLGLLSESDRLWMPGLAGALLCALADYVEDWSELGFIRGFPQAPSRVSVFFAFTATCVKALLFFVGLLLTIAATLSLALVLLWGCVRGQAGTISLILSVYALTLLYGVARDFLSRLRFQKR